MKDFAYKFIARVRQQAKRKTTIATAVSGGTTREFVAYDWGTDTFIFERNVWKTKPQHAPVLVVRKDALIEGREGRIMTVTTGSHAVAAMPLLKGLFWNLGRVDEQHRGDVMTNAVVCCNIVGDTIEISQRDIPTEEVFAADDWLRGLGWSLSNVVLAERTDGALEFYRRLGQEWRIKPLAWTRAEMNFALSASRTRIHTTLSYYHSVKGVHFLSYEDFAALVPLCAKDIGAVHAAVDELVKPAEVGEVPALLDHKFHGHHEIELFGVRDHTVAEQRITKMIVDLQAEQASMPADTEAARLSEICDVYRSSLSYPALADSQSDLFVSSMYRHLTGEIYMGGQDQVVPAFDDHKTALPGATYRGGKPDFHPGADDRTIALVGYVQSLLSEGETMEYANVYELRLEGDIPLGRGPTREIDYKTNRRPVSVRLVEKRLAHQGLDYANYMLVRVQAFQSLGVSYGDHHLLARRERAAGDAYYFVRQRYPGYAINAIAHNRFQRATGENGAFVDFPDAILATAAQIGRAAAQTLVVKKYIAGANPVHFADGTEIIEFAYDLNYRCEMPVDIRLSSIRGSLGWPCIDRTPENFLVCSETYAEAFAQAIVDFWRRHARVVSLDTVVGRFNEGFAAATRDLYWKYVSQRELFHSFDAGLRPMFKFTQKWHFVLWALERQYEQIGRICAVVTATAGRIASAPEPIEPAGEARPVERGDTP